MAKLVFKSGTENVDKPRTDLLNIEMRDIDGRITKMGELLQDKKVAIFVNVATK